MLQMWVDLVHLGLAFDVPEVNADFAAMIALSLGRAPLSGIRHVALAVVIFWWALLAEGRDSFFHVACLTDQYLLAIFHRNYRLQA